MTSVTAHLADGADYYDSYPEGEWEGIINDVEKTESQPASLRMEPTATSVTIARQTSLPLTAPPMPAPMAGSAPAPSASMAVAPCPVMVAEPTPGPQSQTTSHAASMAERPASPPQPGKKLKVPPTSNTRSKEAIVPPLPIEQMVTAHEIQIRHLESTIAFLAELVE